ncbi:hypothetical protein QQM39_25340 [Streptomyces sp. DT2A-34]|uniref:hypothetical protein n=1 Tax=Streptomyces sp. DT2A-34 TaxID=3051182 RepID=UPI00265B7CD6|nr:hypothetical protein [Streptomyces sp. DT2A-34]MDO0914033.1 hypothetical protein [Streptomyces sp. DT2A-34]
MGWDNSADGPEGDRPGDVVRRFVDLNAAAAVCAAQFPAIGLIWLIGTQLSRDDYGGPYSFLSYLALALLLAVTPVLMPFAGLAHAVAHIGPADLLARLAARHVRGPVWAWHLVCTGALGVVWAALAALLWGWSFTSTAALLAALGVLPVFGLAYLRGRARRTGRPQGFWAVWLPSLFASVTLFLLVLVGGVLGTVTRLLGYEPPALSAGRLAGDWRGADGAVLRLDSGGKAELTKLPTESESGDWYTDPIDVCDGTGSWSPGEQGGRDAVLVRLDGGCG